MKLMPLRGKMRDLLVGVAFLLVVGLLVLTARWTYIHYMTTPPYVDPELYPVRGFDISAHNGYANLEAAANAGYQFVFIKASEGTDFRDANFALNYQKARHAGLKTGAYHYFRFDKDGIDQAKNLLRVVGNRYLDLGLALDVEETGNAKGIPVDSVKARLGLMMEYLNMQGYRVTLYSNREGYAKYLLPEFEGYPLWICQFTDNSSNTDWTYWQYDHHGRVPGIRGDVDLNVFYAPSFDALYHTQ